MKREKAVTLLLAVCCFITLIAAAQGTMQNRHTVMRSTTAKVLAALAAGDTATLVNMLDTAYNHLGKPHARNYFADDALQKCRQFKNITGAFTMPPLDSLHLATDNLTGSTLCVLYLQGLPNTALNIRKCAFVVSFYPAKLFSMQQPGQCLGFYFQVIPVNNKTPDLPALQLPTH